MPFIFFSQDEKYSKHELIEINFQANENQKFGFDNFKYEAWQNNYKKIKLEFSENYFVAIKSVGKNEPDFVNAVLRINNQGKSKIDKSSIEFYFNEKLISFTQINDSTFTLNLPKNKSNYSVSAYLKVNNQKYKVGQLDVKVFDIKKVKVVVVPIFTDKIDQNAFSSKINSIYKQANLELDVAFSPIFKSKVFEKKTIFSNPSDLKNQYTGQMRLLRDLYFESNPKADKKAFYVFVINHFVDTTIHGFTLPNKSMAFVSYNENNNKFYNNTARSLAYGIGILPDSWKEGAAEIGPEKASTSNLMDCTFGSDLTSSQWNDLRNTTSNYSFIDNFENVKTNNGIVAYYFWEEDKDGFIKASHGFLNDVKRPYKKNYLSYRFDVKYKILKPFYKFDIYYCSLINVLLLLLILVLNFFIRRRIKRFWINKNYKRKFWRRVLYLPIFVGIIFLAKESFNLGNYILDKFKMVSGPMEELKNLSYKKASKELLVNLNLRHQEESTICSEILIKKKSKWSLKKRMKVLYFDVAKSEKSSSWDKIKLVSNSDSIKLQTLNYTEKASSHYMIFSYLNKDGSIEKQELINHFGENLTSKIEELSESRTETSFDKKTEVNPPKRILIFVNGYRPTSTGHTFEENFKDISNKGIEFPNSTNYVYDFDRFDYWTPWNEVNLLFQKRINPSETYYLDGHFSVSTSNHRSILSFTQLSQQHPKRCKNKTRHTCYYKKNMTIKKSILGNSKTIDDLKMRPNKRGFAYRKQKGRIAGRNLLQVLNEIPKFSQNDTLFVVAHSMGFAYAQGIIEELRGKINFGTYLIIAPENAKSGEINENEWKTVWQYGSNFNKKGFEAPCLQDGVAPQSNVNGLSADKRIYIPKKLYSKKGFFESHFIGYYTWILEIQEGKKGYVENH